VLVSRAINVILPGSGLIPIRREWLGLSLSILFAICVNIFVAGRWIAPLAIPGWLAATALGLAILCWVTAQVLLTHYARRAASVAAEINDLIRQGQADLAEGDRASACAALEAAVALDDESPQALRACIAAYRHFDMSKEAEELSRRLSRVAPRAAIIARRAD
jgi:hypothetical protein